MDVKEQPDQPVRSPVEGDWQHRFADVGGIRLHYVEQGEGFPVLLVHGFPELWYFYRHQIPALAEAGFRAIAPDSRGYGQTERPDGLHEYTAGKKVGELIDLLDVLDIEKAVFVGHDWGAAWVWHAARTYPDRVERVVGTLGVGGIRFWNVMRDHGVPSWPADPDRSLERGPMEALFGPFCIWDRWLRPVSWLDVRTPGYAEHELCQDPDWLEAISRAAAAPTRGGFPDREYVDELVALYGTVEGMKGSIDHYRNFGLNFEEMGMSAANRIECPAMLLAGEDDPWAPPCGSDEKLLASTKDSIPNLTLRWIKGSGHWVQNEQPEEFNRHLLEFLADLAPATR